jgi:hypothetical protein
MHFGIFVLNNGLVPEQIHTLPTEEISAGRRGRGENFFLIRRSVLGHPKRVGRYGCFLE